MLDWEVIMYKVFYDDYELMRVETILDEKIYLGNDYELIDSVMRNDTYIFTFKTVHREPNYKVMINGNPYPLIYRGIIKTSWFMSKYDATDERMGSYVVDNKTYFCVYAPTADSLVVLINNERFNMKRNNNGSFTLMIDSNLHGASYLYEVNMYDSIRTTTDPYAIASMPNRAASVVVDLSKLNIDVKSPVIDTDPIILEASVRDFSMDPDVDFKHRGKFLGMLESHGNYGMQHIINLGITHLQLMPVNDFETVDELNPFKKYNWGYDTMQFMSLEGSYSSDVSNPLQSLYDFAAMVDGYHQHNIGVNLDVVFNHVYEVDDHPYNILAPYYYFRYTDDYELSNGSFCGNEVASEMPMARKHIVDTAVYFVETFNIDGYRFDLMGLLDVETMNEVYTACARLNPNIMIYGEGWSMPTVLDSDKQASIRNFYKMPNIAHFNDRFRDTVAGALNEKDLGYVGGRIEYTESIKAALSAYSDNTYAYQMFDNSSQSINYVECHDNMTVADKVALANKGKKEALLMIGLVLFAQGIPFLQIGQSFFRDKKGDENSYKSPDETNRITWRLLDVNKDMNDCVVKWIETRKKIYKSNEAYEFRQERSLLNYYYGSYHIIFNPSDSFDIIEPKSISIRKHA